MPFDMIGWKMKCKSSFEQKTRPSCRTAGGRGARCCCDDMREPSGQSSTQWPWTLQRRHVYVSGGGPRCCCAPGPVVAAPAAAVGQSSIQWPFAWQRWHVYVSGGGPRGAPSSRRRLRPSTAAAMLPPAKKNPPPPPAAAAPPTLPAAGLVYGDGVAPAGAAHTVLASSVVCGAIANAYTHLLLAAFSTAAMPRNRVAGRGASCGLAMHACVCLIV
jgi:hypothetical protein